MARRNRTAGLLASAAALGALALGVVSNRRTPVGIQDPQSTVYLMVDAARNGDIALYLDQFAAPALEQLRQTVKENGKAAFSNYLRESNGLVEGVAVADPEFSTEFAKVRVEYVYRDHNTAQQLYLTRSGSRWRIVRAEAEDLTQMPIRFGTVLR